MAVPQRKPAEIPDHPYLERHLQADNDNASEEKFEKKLLNDLPHLKARLGDIRMYREFRREFAEIRNANPRDLRIYVVHPEDDIAITRAFELEDDADNVTFLHKTRGEKRAFELRGYRGKKGIAHWHQESEKADIVVIQDEEVAVTAYLLTNVEFGGFLLVPMKLANSVRATGKYACKGVLERHGNNTVLNRDIGPDFWKRSEVKSDEAFEAANIEHIEGIVSHEEARTTLEAAGRKVRGGRVLEDYLQLIKDARIQSGATEEERILRYVMTQENGVSKIVPVNTVLPLEEKKYTNEHLAVFHKKPF